MATPYLAFWRQLGLALTLVFGLPPFAFASDSAPAGPQEPFDFRGVKLGITASQFKLLPIPQDAKLAQLPSFPGLRQKTFLTHAECSNDPGSVLTLLLPEKKLGVVECGWVVTETGYSETRYKSDLRVGDYLVSGYLFRFIAKQGESEPRLFDIRIWLKSEAYQSVSQMLAQKFGMPSKVENFVVKTRVGASFDSATSEWISQTSRVILEQYSGDINTSALRYSLDDHQAFYERQRSAQKLNGGPGI